MNKQQLLSLQKEKLKPRPGYLARLKGFQDTEPVKIITGIRRCGKSSLLKLMMLDLYKQGIAPEQILYFRFESLEISSMNYLEFYHFVKNRILPGKKMYLFFDEPQIMPGWEKAVNSFRVDFPCDLYVTGSNAYMLSSEYATLLSGRYIELHMFPLSFKEFLEFQGYTLQQHRTLLGETKWQALSPENTAVPLSELFAVYMRFGGMPGITDLGLQQDRILALLDGIYSTVIMRDILEREERKGRKRISDPLLLRKIILFLADSIGSSISLSSISNTLTSNKMLENKSRQGKPAINTVSAYVDAILQAYLFYEIKRFDIRGRQELKTLGKYYIVDPGLRNYLLGYRSGDTGHMLENTVYFELLRRGFDVAVGKIGSQEIDFIAIRQNSKMYVQVTESIRQESTRQRELAPLLQIRDNYPKLILVGPDEKKEEIEGIQVLPITDFLLEGTA